VHFLDLASATEKLRWAEKEWRELEQEMEGDARLSQEDRPHLQEARPDLVEASN
jgi:hypothetical protein